MKQTNFIFKDWQLKYDSKQPKIRIQWQIQYLRKGVGGGGGGTYQGPDLLKAHSQKDPWPPLDLPLIAFLPI